ncbi:MAG TPA: hypothetical protein VF395_04995 [Polyangiaceae bacterium]
MTLRPALLTVLLLGAGCEARPGPEHGASVTPDPSAAAGARSTAPTRAPAVSAAPTRGVAVSDAASRGTVAAGAFGGPVPPEARAAHCARRLAELEGLPGLPSDVAFEARRSETFLRAKADSVLLVRAPVASGLTLEGARLRHAILDAPDPVRALYGAYPKLSSRRDLAREALLTEGYLYAAAPAFASALASLVRPEDLFVDPEIRIERGAATFRAVRAPLDGAPAYVHADGPFAGKRVKLLLLDRVSGAAGALAEPLHRDVSAIARELGFDRMRVRHLTTDAITADLGYGDVWVPAVLNAEGARVSLECEMIPEGISRKVLSVRDAARRLASVVERLRQVIDQEVEEGLPFDEPKTEVGQQDGKLRQHWSWAYRYGQSHFAFNDDRYRVFDGLGRPRVPQVCIDFVTDTFERASGSWYRPLGEARERTQGRLDFGTLGIDNERSVERFVEFAKAHPEWFEVVELPDEERVPYSHRDEFFAHIAAHADRYRPGDVVTIYGLRADGKMHYHSFFVYSTDPVTGTPSLVAANAGRPRVRPFEGEMQSAPLRSIRARIRPRLEWLESVTGAVPPSVPLPVSAPVPTVAPSTLLRPIRPIRPIRPTHPTRPATI